LWIPSKIDQSLAFWSKWEGSRQKLTAISSFTKLVLQLWFWYEGYLVVC
jgi:hypothetical protein